MHFGFSYIGLLYLFMLFIPNFFWTRNKPLDYEKYAANENKILLCMERTGEAAVCCFVLIFSDYNVHEISLWSLWLLMSLILMILYECYWIRYFKSEKRLKDFYCSLLGVPVAGATLPVAAFFLLGIYGKNPLLLISTTVLGIGHIGIHIGHYKEAVAADETKSAGRK